MKPSMHMEDPLKKEQNRRRHFSFRINLFFFCTFLLFSVLIVRLAILQFVESKQLAAEENTTTNTFTKIAPIRGNIYDQTGVPLAYTIPVQSLFFRIEPGQQDKDVVIGLASKLADVFEKYGKKEQKKITAADIVLAMDLGYDINKNPVKPPSFYHVPRRIKTDLTKAEIAYLLERRDEYKWLEVTEESIRTYETTEDKTTIATQLVGYLKSYSTEVAQEAYKENPNAKDYLGTEDVGIDGLEQMYQDVLRGKNGEKMYPVNAAQKIIGRVTVTPPKKGNNLYLTINKDMQLATEQAITDHLAYLKSNEARNLPFVNAGVNARSGYAVAMEVKTGKVVSMASMPDYNSNLWTGGILKTDYDSIQAFINNGTIRTALPNYPPKELGKHASSIVFMGSTIKPLTVLIGLNEGVISLSSTYNDSGSFTFGKGKGSTITNSGGTAYGYMNPTMAIQHSSNTFMSEKVGIPFYSKFGGENKAVTQKWADYLAKFGLGVSTGSGLPGEFSGANDFIKNAVKDSYQSAMVYASWGQNERYTTLQLAQFAATLGSRGKRMKPQFVDTVKTYEGEVVQSFKPEVVDEVKFPDVYWDAVIKGMKSGAEGIGGEGLDDLPYHVARKTGTSTQDVSGGRVDNAVFIAFAPAENPVLAVAVVVPEGGFGRYGASPIAAKMFEAYDKLYNGALSAPGTKK
jgi:penicillin-binding protein 2